LEGIGEINDEILIENVEIKKFDVSKSIAVSSPTTVGGAIDDIELFKSKVQNIISSLNGNDLEMTIPSIAVFFGLDSFEISSSNYNLISEFANVYCQTNKEAVILVDGYTCDLGSDDYNNKLSKDRANIVKQVLVSRGVPAEKIILNYYGKSMYGKLDVSGREAHRRANISIK
jgi:outer membrane protein OmpA-like peptidoglycan-associated protein